ncbi:MAG: RHS repeat-associated core domain-containing protein [Ignavibacteriales bacterium]|nr:RHS repeat-associated core domain-containing protein [Ignavibacteriales bacterium]
MSNIIREQFRDISGITYNLSNLPEQLTADGNTVSYWYDNNGNRFRKQESNLDEVYVLGINGETEAVFNAGGSIKFFNINAARPFGSNETICRQTLVSLPDSRGVNTIYLNTKYKFTSKERDVETGYDYFGARYYDSRIGRWLQIDPLSEKYFGWSPYNYTLNNPLKKI